MNHYETVFILNPVLSDVQEGNSKQKIFLLQEEPQWFKEDWGQKKWLTKFKTKKVVSITYLNSMFQEKF
jgi:small subunit ribosomal protein S6